jgi:hypothetical protein
LTGGPLTDKETTVTKKILLVGLTEAVIDDARQQVGTPDTELLVGTGIDDVRSAFARGDIDHVIMGAGIDLEARLEIVREIFQSSDTTTVHMKDRASGPEGFLPFVRSVLRGLSDFH